MAAALRGRATSADPERLEAVRTAVLDKNWHWFNRFRATDGNDVWGTRSVLAFTDGQTNGEVLQHELTQLDEKLFFDVFHAERRPKQRRSRTAA